MPARSRAGRHPDKLSAASKRAGGDPENQATLQPPLPLQLFLPLQPMSPEVQPPWPLQEFWPLQSCLLMALSEDFAPLSFDAQPAVVMIVPATNPVIAAEIISALAVRVIITLLVASCSLGPPANGGVHTARPLARSVAVRKP